jgi:hypothetical protein
MPNTIKWFKQTLLSFWFKRKAKLFKSLADCKSELLQMGSFFYEVFFDPILFGFVLFILFPRIWAILEAADETTEFLLVLAGDIMLNPAPYALFCFVFIIWLIAKGLHRRYENRNRKQLTDTLKNLNETLTRIENKLDE